MNGRPAVKSRFTLSLPEMVLLLLRSLMPLLVLVVLLQAVALSVGERGLQVVSAYYMPDPPPPVNSHATEGDLKHMLLGKIFKPLQSLYENYEQFGGARVVLYNDSDGPVRIDSGIQLNGKPIEDHYVDFLDGEWDDRGVVWYRVRPRVLQAGQCGQIYIRFRRRPAGDKLVVMVQPNRGATIEMSLTYEEPGVSVDYVTTDETGDTLYVYARQSEGSQLGRLESLTLDGKPIENVDVYGADFPGNVSLAVARLDHPLKVGEFHVAGVQTTVDDHIAAQFRVHRFFFMRTSWRWFPRSVEEVKQLHMNTVFQPPLKITAERAEELGVYIETDKHRRSAYEYFFDEPDSKDVHPKFFEKYGEWKDEDPAYTGKAWAVGLGMNARQRVTSGRFEKLEQEAPHVLSYIIINGTTRPLNWSVYGHLADVASTDPYPCNIFGMDFPTVREQLGYLRKVSAPKIMHACLETSWFRSQNNDPPRRAPTAGEFRQMAVQALGCGSKGMHSWLWPTVGSFQGAVDYPELKEEYVYMNKLMHHLEKDLLLGTPIDIVSNDSGLTETGSWFHFAGEYKLKKPWMKERVWTGALLCGPDTIVIAVANHIPASIEPQQPQAARDVRITVQLPPFLRNVSAWEATGHGEAPFACKVEAGEAVLELDAIETGRMFVLRRTTD